MRSRSLQTQARRLDETIGWNLEDLVWRGSGQEFLYLTWRPQS